MLAKLTKSYVIGLYEERIDHENAQVQIEGMEYSPAHVLKMVDPEVYQQGLSDYIDYLTHQGYVVEQ